MRTVMLVGRTHCGKTTFCQALFNLERTDKKTQSIEIVNSAIDTPGEYMENPRFYRALLVSSVDAEMIILMQDCTDDSSIYPPAFAAMFSGKPVIGVVNKIDLGDSRQLARGKEFLRQAGADPLFQVSAFTGKGMSALRRVLTTGNPGFPDRQPGGRE